MITSSVRLVRIVAIAIVVSLSCYSIGVASSDPLSLWNDNSTKSAIIDFVGKITLKDSPDYIAADERIAVFDNDGTLWAEQPMYFQAFLVFDRIKMVASSHPEWKELEPYKYVLSGEYAKALAGGEEALLEMVMATHSGMTTDEFAEIVTSWINTAKHPTTGKVFTEMVYQPMLELLDYLRNNDFKTFIVSGGGIEFMRPWTEKVYGIPPEQVIGSSVKTKFDVEAGKPVIKRLAEIHFIDDKAGKPVGINQHIGRRPILAFGNSDGDFQMLEWVSGGEKANLSLILHHTDDKREFAYDRESHIGRLSKGLDEAKGRGWIIVDMKDDWKRVFPAN